MRCTLLVLFLLLPFSASAQNLTTTPATVQAGASQFLAPSDARDALNPGLDLAVRGRLGGEGEVRPTINFGFERRWGSGTDLYGMDLRFGVRSTGPVILGLEGGMKLRSRKLGSTAGLSGSSLRPVAAAYAAYRSGRFQIGPTLTASVWEDVAATAGVSVGYVIR